MKIENRPISRLSFTILNDDLDIKDKNDAFKEIKRRFKNNACDYNMFMEYEEIAIDKRGKDICNYLIQDNPSFQQLISIYLNYVYKNGNKEHGNLLFSEVLLCNECGRSQFIKFLKLELSNIKLRLNNNNLSYDDIRNLNLLLDILDKRIVEKSNVKWYESSVINSVLNIINGPNSFYNQENVSLRIEKMDKKIKEFENGNYSKIIPIIFSSLPDMICNIDFVDYLHMYLIAYKELIKLDLQNKSLINSLEQDNMDYSCDVFKSLILRK